MSHNQKKDQINYDQDELECKEDCQALLNLS